MYKRADFTHLEGLGFTQDTLDFLQQSYRDTLGALAKFMGDLVIIDGVADLGATYGDGWVAINGELLPFTGGTKTLRIIIEEVVAQEEFSDETQKDVYYTRTAKLGTVGGYLIADFVRLTTAKQLVTDVATALANIPTVKYLDEMLVLDNVTSAEPQNISEADLPNCKIGFWCTFKLDATNAGDVGVLTYRLSGVGAPDNILRQVDTGYAGNANNSEHSFFCPLSPGKTGTFSIGHYIGATAWAEVKIIAYI